MLSSLPSRKPSFAPTLVPNRFVKFVSNICCGEGPKGTNILSKQLSLEPRGGHPLGCLPELL
eukprot:scaffold3556_cov67-Attheya_sp.AAC.11